MHHEPRWRRYVRFWRRSAVDDVRDELTFHLEQRVDEFTRDGLSPGEAAARAAERFGDIDQVSGTLAEIDERIGRRRDQAVLIDALRQDLVYALRALRRSPAFVVACVATLALGVGANGAVWTLADRLFVRAPLGVVDPAHLRRLYTRTFDQMYHTPSIGSLFTYPAFAALDSALGPGVRFAAYFKPDTMPMQDGNASMTVRGSYVSASFMPTLGVRPALGRFFGRDDDVMGTPTYVAVLSFAFWQRQFGGDSAVLGQTIVVNRVPVTVVGVAQRNFAGADLSATDVWMPLASVPASPNAEWYQGLRATWGLRLVARVDPGASDAWLANAATTVVRRAYLATDMRGRSLNVLKDTGGVVLVGPVLESLGPSTQPVPVVSIAKDLLGVAVIVLLIACANVAGLMLARASGRRREIAVRVALGISRRRLVALLALEALLLAVPTGVIALFVSVWAGSGLRALIMPDTYWVEAVFDVRIASVTIALSVVAAMAASLMSAMQSTRPELTTALKGGAHEGSIDVRRARLRATLLVVQVALSVVLLYGAALFVRSLVNVRSIDIGYDADRLVSATVRTVDPRRHYVDYAHPSIAALSRGLPEAARRLERMPEVERTALAEESPMYMGASVSLELANHAAVPHVGDLKPAWILATPSYFATTGVRLVKGRLFTDVDHEYPPPVVVNEIAARAYWPKENPVGQCLRLVLPTDPTLRAWKLRDPAPCLPVIGVVSDAHLREVIEDPVVEVYTPLVFPPTGEPMPPRYLIVRTEPGNVPRVAAAMRRELEHAFPPSIETSVIPIVSIVEPQLRPWQLGSWLFTAFGALAVIVAAIGTYSVLAYTVSQRSHELSVRMAMGAAASDVIELVVAYGLRVTGAGIVIGIGIALVLARSVAPLLYGTSPHDPVTAAFVALLMAIVAVAASVLPAWRASRSDPAAALRAE